MPTTGATATAMTVATTPIMGAGGRHKQKGGPVRPPFLVRRVSANSPATAAVSHGMIFPIPRRRGPTEASKGRRKAQPPTPSCHTGPSACAGSRAEPQDTYKRFLFVGRCREMVGTMSILFQQNVRANYPSERPAYEGVDYAVAAIWAVGVI